MATITVTAGAYNMLLQDPIRHAVNLLVGERGTGNSTQRTYQGAFETLIIRGTFSNFNSNGDPTRGTITSFEISNIYTGLSTLNVTGLSLSVPTVFGWIAGNDLNPLYNAVFGGADTITGGAGDDELLGYGGDDIINGGAGSDEICGDTYIGTRYTTGFVPPIITPGNDTLNGGAGFDLLFGGLGNDLLNGDGDNDLLHGNEGDDSLNGGDGNDQLFGDDGNDTLSGGAGNDVVEGGAGADSLSGGEGDDTFRAGPLATLIDGGAGIDTLDVLDLSVATSNLFISPSQLLASAEVTFETGITIRSIERINLIRTGSGNDIFDLGDLTLPPQSQLDGGAGVDRLLRQYSRY